MTLRKLNNRGIAEFEHYLGAGAEGPPPLHLLKDPACSDRVSAKISPPADISIFPDRYVFGNRLNGLLQGLDPAAISRDQGLWTGLALLWFDYICPPRSGGKRTLGKMYYYILSTDYRHYYRHLIRSPWQLVRDHGQDSKFLLIAPRESRYPLSVHGEILEQFGGRQQVIASKAVIAAASRLCFDSSMQRPKKGVAGSARGSARRFSKVFKQFDLTYDPPGMTPEALTKLLPKEFDRWQ